MGAGRDQGKNSSQWSRGWEKDHLYGKCCFPHTSNVSCSTLEDNVSFLTIVICCCQRRKEEIRQRKKKKKKERETCPWKGDNSFNRARSRNPHASPCTDCPETTGHSHSHSHAQYPAGPPAGAWSPSERTEVFKLPLSYPNYLLFLINQQHCSLLQDLMLSYQVRGCLLRINKGNILTEVFKLYSKCWRWQGLWTLVIILQCFSP